MSGRLLEKHFICRKDEKQIVISPQWLYFDNKKRELSFVTEIGTETIGNMSFEVITAQGSIEYIAENSCWLLNIIVFVEFYGYKGKIKIA